MLKYTGRIGCGALTDLVIKCFSNTSVPISRSTIFRLNIYGGCTNQVYFRAGEGTKFM